MYFVINKQKYDVIKTGRNGAGLSLTLLGRG